MKLPQFSIGSLLAAVAMIALCAGFMRSPRERDDGLLFLIVGMAISGMAAVVLDLMGSPQAGVAYTCVALCGAAVLAVLLVTL